MNTGNGWATWNSDGDFVKWYVQDSVAHGMVAAFPYYQMLQSTPATGSGEAAKDLNNLKNPGTMAAYWADVRLFMQKAEAGASGQPVILHVEPDLWGYIEQAASGNDAATVPAAVASSGDADLAGLPNTAAGFAKAFIHLRDLYAPHVLVAYHLSVWGTMFDLHASQTSDAETDTLAAKAASFYGSLGAGFDLAFTDLADRDEGFYQYQYGDGGAAWWNASDFPRYGRFIGGFSSATGKRVVVWQIPMGNTKMRATNDTWGHYADNRPEWFLDDVTDGNLASWRDDGVIALLFGGGAGGTTCACDGVGDGTTNPPASGTHTRLSLSADDDGGYLRDRVAAYYSAGGLSLDAGDTTPPPPPPRRHPAPAAGRPLRDVGRRVAQAGPPPARPQGDRPRARVGGSEGPRRRRDLRAQGRQGEAARLDGLAGRGRHPDAVVHLAHRGAPQARPLHGQDRRVRARLGRAAAVEQQGDDVQRPLSAPRAVSAISPVATTRSSAVEAAACEWPAATAGPAHAASPRTSGSRKRWPPPPRQP